MRILLDVGKANVNAKNYGSSTPLHYAALGGNIEAATLLIERGAEINPINDDNDTPLDKAHVLNHTDMIAFLTTKGAVTGPQPVAEEGNLEERCSVNLLLHRLSSTSLYKCSLCKLKLIRTRSRWTCTLSRPFCRSWFFSSGSRLDQSP